jgi:ubiquitin-protein ligase
MTAVEKRRTNALMNQYRKAISEPSTFAMYSLDPNDIGIWYIKLFDIGGDRDEFVGGEYLVKITAPPEFPMKPPHFEMLTPNGVYGINCKVCISIGEYHANSYRATLGIAGFVQQLMSGLVGWETLGGGINIVKSTVTEKKKLAADSRGYNAMNNKVVDDLIKASYAEYSKNWAVTTSTNTTTSVSPVTSVNTTNPTTSVNPVTSTNPTTSVITELVAKLDINV